MWKTILRRLLIMIPQLVILSMLVFLLAKLMPGDPFTGLITPTTDPSRIEELRVQAGFYDPWYVQYKNWIVNALQGDFGKSYQFKVPVADLIGSRAKNTFFLSLLTLFFTYMIAVPLGVLAGRYPNTFLDRMITGYSYVSFAIPTFVLALLSIFIFGYRLDWFPTTGSVDVGLEPGSISYIMNRIYHMILPALTFAVLATTVTIQYLRNEIIDAKQSDYVKTARSKGVPENKIYTDRKSVV